METFAKPTEKRKVDLGICSSCKTASTCTYLKDLARPVLQCEDFDGYEPRPVRTTVKKILSIPGPKFGSQAEEKDLGKYKGLCSICEDRKTCTFIRPEGGVWHCEEYH